MRACAYLSHSKKAGLVLTRLALNYLLCTYSTFVLHHCREMAIRFPASNKRLDVDLMEARRRKGDPARLLEVRSPRDERRAGFVRVMVRPSRSVSHCVKRKEIMKSSTDTVKWVMTLEFPVIRPEFSSPHCMLSGTYDALHRQ